MKNFSQITWEEIGKRETTESQLELLTSPNQIQSLLLCLINFVPLGLLFIFSVMPTMIRENNTKKTGVISCYFGIASPVHNGEIIQEVNGAIGGGQQQKIGFNLHYKWVAMLV